MTNRHPVRVRDYSPQDDLASLIALVRELQSHEEGLYDRMRPAADMGDWYIEHLARQCRDHAGRLLVAESRGLVVGYASILTRVEESSVDEIAHSYAYVGDLAVAAAMRGQGIARRLLEACEAEARRRGAGHLRVTALAANIRAREVYRAFGFADLFVDLEKPLRQKEAMPCD